MDATLRSRAKEIFLDALEEPLERRTAFVARAAEGDRALRAAVEDLLAGHGRAAEIEGWIPGGTRVDDGLAVGDVLGSYELLAELDTGASGRIFRARQQGLEREVALKVPHAGRLASAAEVARFRREAEAVARLDHPGIVPVIDVDEANGHHFFSMKLVEGGSLAERRAEFEDPSAAVALVETVARAVHHAHQRGILHRDLKPSNILLDRSGRPFVADFGIAARLGGAAGDDRIVVAGTPAYMAPEQAIEGEEPTTAADVWALGCVLFELLEGAPPFRGGSVTDSLRRARDDAAPPLTRVRSSLRGGRAADLEAIVRHCLEKAPADRYGSARALADDLARWRAVRQVSARTPTVIERLHMRLIRQPWTSSLAAAVVVLAAAIAVVAPLVSLELGRRLQRAEDAEGVARSRLRDALLAQAEAERRGAEPGRRARALAYLAEAAAIAPGSDLRDEAIRALGELDVETTRPIDGLARGESVLCIDDGARSAVVTGRDGSGRIVDLASGETVLELRPPSGVIRVATFDRGGRRLLVRTNEGGSSGRAAVHLLDAATGAFLGTWSDGVTRARFDFDPTGARFALLQDDLTLAVRDSATGREITGREITVGEVPDSASSLVFAPDGGSVYVSTGAGRSVVRVDLATAAAETVIEELGADTTSSDIDPAGRRLLVGTYGSEAILVDLASGSEVARFRGHAAEVPQVAFVDDETVATSSWDGLVRLWDSSTGARILEWPGRVIEGGEAHDGSVFTEIGGHLDASRLSRSPALKILTGHAGKSPRAVACPSGGAWIATGAHDGLRLWDPATGALLRHVDGTEALSMVATADGASLYVSRSDGLVRHDVAPLLAGEPAAPTTIVGERCEDIALSNDGRRLAVMRPFESITIFDLSFEPPRELRTLEGPGRIAGLDLTADGSRLVAGAWRGRGARVWDVRTGEVLFDRVSDQRQVFACFDARGERVFTVRPDALQTWSAAGALLDERVLPNSRSNAAAGALEADPGGRWIAVVVDLDTVELRDAASLAVGARLWLGGAPFQAVRFVPKTPLLMTATSDGRAVVWDLARLAGELEGLGLGMDGR